MGLGLPLPQHVFLFVRVVLTPITFMVFNIIKLKLVLSEIGFMPLCALRVFHF